MTRTAHLLTVDVEDWPQSTLDHSLPIGEGVRVNTHALLELFERAGVRGTFFVLGKVAEVHPTLAGDIAAAGHEVGTHGHSHRSVEHLPLPVFKEELHRSVELLREQTGQPVVGHRAADFSISRRSLHLLDALSEEGLEYDSSIFPVWHRRYGIPGAWRHPHTVRCASGRTLIEFPLATIPIPAMPLPAGGGGYFRLFPYWWTDFAIRNLEREGSLATCYLHPYEIDTTEMGEVPYQIPLKLRWTQGTNRRSVRPKLQKLLSSFSFTTMGEACAKFRAQKLEVGLDLTKQPATYERRMRTPVHVA